MSKKVSVKVCCIKSMEEAEMAMAAGASAIGLVGPMPSGPGVIDNHLIREIAEQMNDRIQTFLLTSDQKASDIKAHHDICRTSTIQLVDHVEFEELSKVKDALPDVRLIQVLHVLDDRNIEEAIEVSEFVDGLLLDSGNPNLAIKELGGTGRTHDWAISSKIVSEVNVPVFLAGGLKPKNVKQALINVRPFGVDLCSGIRIAGNLDKDLLDLFMEEVKSVYQQMRNFAVE